MYFSTSHTLNLSFLNFPLLHLSSFLTLFGTRGRNHPIFSPIFRSGVNGSPVNYFFRVMAQSMIWPDKICCCSLLQCPAVSLFLPPVPSGLLFRLKAYCFNKIFDTRTSISTKELVLPHHTCSLLSRFAAMNAAFFYLHYLCSSFKKQSFVNVGDSVVARGVLTSKGGHLKRAVICD